MADSINFNYSEVEDILGKLKNANDILNFSFISNDSIRDLNDLVDLLDINYFSSLNTFVRKTYDENFKYINVGQNYYNELMDMNLSYKYNGDDTYTDNSVGGGPDGDSGTVSSTVTQLTTEELNEIGEPAASTVAGITGSTNADELHDIFVEIATAINAIEPYLGADAAKQLELLEALVNGGSVNGITLSPDALRFCIEYIESITGLTIEELLSGKYPDKLNLAIDALYKALQLIESASNLSEAELELAMSGEAEEIAGLTSNDKTNLMLLLVEMLKENGGIEAIYGNPKLMEQLKNLADAYTSLTNIGKMTSTEKADTLKSLLGDNPTINGFTIPPEIRDYILAQIQAKTGLTLEQILSGDYPEALDSAFAEVMAILNSYGINALYSTNEKMDILSGLAGDNPTINGIAISPELRDYILAQIQAKTGLTLQQLLSGQYPDLLEVAFAEAMAILDANGINTLYSTKEKMDILSGLTGDTPTINGILIPLEIRDKILAQIQAATGLTLEQILSGQYPEMVELAFSEMLGIVQLYGIFGSVSQEEMEKFMEHLLDGQYPDVCGITPVTAKTMRDYLLAIAGANGITVEELLSNPKYADYLKQELANFAVSQEEVLSILMLDNASLQAFLLGVYDGDAVTINGIAISESTANIIRVYLDNLALSLGVSVEELLTDPQYQEILRNAMNDLNKYLSFMDLMTLMESKEIQARLLQMINGERAGLLGFTNENLTEFNKILEEYASANNTTREDLLTNTEFAQATSELLNNTEVGKEISLLFPNYNEQQKQEVLNKIMISWNQDNEERIMNLFEYINNQNIETSNN